MIVIICATVLGMFLTQLFVYKSLPKGLQHVIAYVPAIGFIADFMFSGTFLIFTGVGTIAGIANIIASVFFGFYLEAFKRSCDIRVSIDMIGWGPFKYPQFNIHYTEASGLFKVLF